MQRTSYRRGTCTTPTTGSLASRIMIPLPPVLLMPNAGFGSRAIDAPIPC